MNQSSLTIEFGSKIIYEYDQQMVEENDPDDKAEIELNQKRLLKTISEAHIQNQAFVNVQGSKKSTGNECAIMLQISENKDLTEEFLVCLIKAGGQPKKKPEEAKATEA